MRSDAGDGYAVVVGAVCLMLFSLAVVVAAVIKRFGLSLGEW